MRLWLKSRIHLKY